MTKNYGRDDLMAVAATTATGRNGKKYGGCGNEQTGLPRNYQAAIGA